ncbi:MAG: preprotein translocase subunit SecG [Gammaproteobacteria bacterium RIFCSPHIGHO2_02_FULL_39_13]|nr:MAG: preprotein translocase subunit SecG [Gammaproteobacteria bacterium RIFCSPHIGHO2_02_FULL_39_13]OGT50003.1 MAG: preprotein translocase subunit SecG [Gammaproteobacteria bacterium RIFCSPHIGHO2_12_FULL_39_24]
MQSLILILHVLIAIAIIALVLLQHGRGADVGASFGSGSSNTMFGSAGALPFLMKVTAVCAVIFFTTSISLSYLAARDQKKVNNVTMPVMPAQTQTTVPVADGFSYAPSEKK